MKSVLVIIVSFFILPAFGQEESPREFEMTMGDTTYYMKQYVFCMYKKGATSSSTKEEKMKLQEAHLAHLIKLSKEGIIQLSGPFGDDGMWRGILIMNVETVEEAKKYIDEDPLVKAGRLTYELHPWWGAKGTTLK